MTIHPVVTPDEWATARKQLLQTEKAHTRQGDLLSKARRELPWLRIDKPYVFDGPEGPVSLADLFEGRSQLVVQHFMFGPDWTEGCVGCSFHADHVDDAFQHLYHHDVSFVAIARAPYEQLAAFKERMGWKFRMVSAYESDFNSDFDVSVTQADIESGRPVSYGYQEFTPDGESEMPGTSVFIKDEDGVVYLTYSTFGRDDEQLSNAYNLLDIAPLGRNEPNGNMDWVRHHDRYDAE